VADVHLTNVKKQYPNGFVAIEELNLSVKDGEFLVLVGPSGCGKSTLLRMIAGLEEITDGEVQIGGRRVNEVAPKNRDIAMVFQNYALYPHMTVGENIGFALKLGKVKKTEIIERVQNAAKILELEPLLDRKPGQLSGGQRQRVAMGRAIVRQPQAFLMDEPLSNLDAKLRVQMRAEISAITQDLGVTTIYVTHDQIEAMTMGDRVAVLKEGDLMQVDSPQNLYDHPANLFVAGFIGSPSMSLMQVTVVDADGGLGVKIGETVVALDPSVEQSRPSLRSYLGKEVAIGIRPEHFEIADQNAANTLQTTVMLVESLGSEVLVHFALGSEQITVDADLAAETTSQSRHSIARLPPSFRASAGDPITLTFSTETAHYFELRTGEAITD
jgi:multiple sugar transport system ATP-binding protein